MSESGQEKIEFWDFLMNTPPGKEVAVINSTDANSILKPSIILYCDDDDCRKEMWFDCDNCWGYLSVEKWSPCTLLYKCRHCKRSLKWISLMIYHHSYSWPDKVIKFGESPPFGPHTPARVVSLIGPDKELFLKGRQSEARGLGIGAFTYYRRVVENNWQRLLDEVIKVSKKLNLPTIEVLEKARAEQQFDKAVKMVKDAIPQVLLIDGHNPMTILYKITSEGIHELTDDQCLELAKHIRVVLADFAGRVVEALRERKELQDSLTKLFQSEVPEEPS